MIVQLLTASGASLSLSEPAKELCEAGESKSKI